jgi:hypothetical protein
MSEEKASSANVTGRCLCMGAGPAFTEMIEKLAPEEGVRRHFTNARIEFLKGLRAMIDRRIENLSQEKEKGSKIDVE